MTGQGRGICACLAGMEPYTVPARAKVESGRRRFRPWDTTCACLVAARWLVRGRDIAAQCRYPA